MRLTAFLFKSRVEKHTKLQSVISPWRQSGGKQTGRNVMGIFFWQEGNLRHRPSKHFYLFTANANAEMKACVASPHERGAGVGGGGGVRGGLCLCKCWFALEICTKINAQFGELKSRITLEATELTELYSQQIYPDSLKAYGESLLAEQSPAPMWDSVDCFCWQRRENKTTTPNL